MNSSIVAIVLNINPGDTEHKLTTITKVTSGSVDEVATWVTPFMDQLFQGTDKASSLKG